MRDGVGVIMRSSNPDATVLELAGLNHLFQDATTGAVSKSTYRRDDGASGSKTIAGYWTL